MAKYRTTILICFTIFCENGVRSDAVPLQLKFASSSRSLEQDIDRLNSCANAQKSIEAQR